MNRAGFAAFASFGPDYSDVMVSRTGQVTYQDCVAITNRSTSTVAHVQVVFSAVDVQGTPKRPNLPLDLRATVNGGPIMAWWRKLPIRRIRQR